MIAKKTDIETHIDHLKRLNEKIETDDESFEMIPEPNEAGNTKHSQAYVIDHCKQSRNWDFW